MFNQHNDSSEDRFNTAMQFFSHYPVPHTRVVEYGICNNCSLITQLSQTESKPQDLINPQLQECFTIKSCHPVVIELSFSTIWCCISQIYQMSIVQCACFVHLTNLLFIMQQKKRSLTIVIIIMIKNIPIK